MSLQRKFIVLLGLLGLTVLGSLTAATWTFIAQHRALAGPFRDSPKFLRSISDVSQHLGSLRATLHSSDLTARDEFNHHLDKIDDELKAMSDSDLYIASGSESAIKTLSSRLKQINDLAPRWFDAHESLAREEIDSLAARIAERCNQIQLRVLEDHGRVIDFSNTIVGKLVRVLISTAVAAIMLGVLALFLVRRWVLRPVRELRTAAAQIAAGRFEHQIPVRGRDEIARLSMEVNSMASTIRQMLDERVERERLAALGEMVRRLAHSLRNPLSGIRSLAEVTRDELPRDSDLREHQNRILKAVDRFEAWLSDLLNTTKPLQLQIASVDPRRLINDVVDTHRALAQSKKIEVIVTDTSAPEVVNCDAAQLEHAIVSILTNAVQASPVGGRISIALSKDVPESHWEIRISDQGPGVPLELREKIFLPYFTTKKEGTGIGLAISQQVIRNHGGRISIESESNTNTSSPTSTGCTFVVRIPLNPSGSSYQPLIVPPGGSGVPRAQDPDHRGRRESPVLYPTHPGQVGPVRL